MVVSSPASCDSVYGLLVTLASQAHGLEPKALRQRLVDGIARYYGAVSCSLHLDESGWPVARGDAQGVLGRLPALARARVDTIDARMVRDCIQRDGPVSAVDLDADLRSDALLRDLLGVSDVFALPLRAAGRVQGVLVLYLALDSRSISGGDLEALGGVGEMVRQGAGGAPTAPPPQAVAPRGALSFLKRLLG